MDSNNASGIFEYFPDGFTIELQGKKRRIVWSEIESLDAYKLDLMKVDEICLNIVLNETYITITEETDGWTEFVEKIQLQFPSIDKDWWGKVAFPAFETNFTTLYKRT